MIGDITFLDYAVDTLIGTGVLIAAALLLRRPVARWFGPRAAYALWALPMIRLALPPLVLPAWMRPAEEAAPVADAAMTANVPLFADKAPPVLPPADLAAMGDPAPSLIAPDVLVGSLVFVWLAVAAAFLVWRWGSYHAMRRMLLKGARPVGEWEDIRLVETDAVRAPVAFGVFDKVIAMPVGFMADLDSTGRDLAIAHEIAHHRGHDLLANIAAQPLLALHWFNPIAWLGWRAMRRDQEAACDARVMDSLADGGRDAATRAHYGSVIAASAREQNLALAAPMAGFREIGPLLGEKAIVHRLRSLAMSPSRLRRRTGLLLIGAGALLAVPLTASISYAEAQIAEVPAPPSVPAAPDVPMPPPAPQPPEATLPPEPPMPPEPPLPPEAPAFGTYSDGTDSWIFETKRELEHADAEMAREQAELRREMHEIRGNHDMSKAERARVEAELKRASAEMERARVQIRHSTREAMRAAAAAPQVHESVSADGKVRTIRVSQRGPDGRNRIVQEHVIDEGAIERAAMQAAIAGVEGARVAIASSASMSADVRAEALAELDAELAEMRRDMHADHH
ncbi:MAG: antirepressor regulating drug resistance protein [Croceicoccus sp.]|nr:antirepressor regulating drug resistance protein [Croceicoccus sp.]MAL24673.1 antirepressor regulating drug resistance protein [Croceicoccus sp.]|tara:strand:+ start:15065 stop:16768 length:1704 start_codon:yes stop_codon:yes gene_type:complete